MGEINQEQEVIQTNYLFRDLTPGEISKIRAISEVSVFHTDQYICREFDVADSLFLIVSGAIEACKQDPITKQPVKLSKLGAGAMVGELAFLISGERTADLIVRETSIVMKIKYSALNSIFATNKEIMAKIYKTLATEVAHKLDRLSNEVYLKNH